MVSTRKKKTSSSKSSKAAAPSSARGRRPRPAWDNTNQDHSQFRFSKDEMERRKDMFTSRHQMPGVERLKELCEKYERTAKSAAQKHSDEEEEVEIEVAEDQNEEVADAVEEEQTNQGEDVSTSRLGQPESFDALAKHAGKYGKLDPHEIIFEYRTSNRAQKIVDNIQQIIDINIGKIETMMSEMNVGTIKNEVRSIRSDVDEMKETQLLLRDEIKSMKKEFGSMMSGLQTNFQSLLTDKYNPRTQFSSRQLESGPYSSSQVENALSFSEPRSPLPSVPIHVRKTPKHPLFVDGDEDDIDLPLYSEMLQSQVRYSQ